MGTRPSTLAWQQLARPSGPPNGTRRANRASYGRPRTRALSGATVASVISLAEPAPGSPPQSARDWRRQRPSTSRRPPHHDRSHDNAADAGMVVTRVLRVPAPRQKDLEPGAEIHWINVDRNVDVAEIPGAIVSGNVHAAAERRVYLCRPTLGSAGVRYKNSIASA